MQAIAAARDLGRTLDFGDSTNVYRITSTLAVSNGSSRLSWRGNGATIKFDPSSHAKAVIDIALTGGEYLIEGLLIDADRSANAGLLIINTSDGSSESHYADLMLNDVRIINPRRINTTFLQSADGMYISGAYSRVVINRARVRNSVVEAGAAVLGSYGAFGITVSNRSGAAARYVAINDCIIDGIFSTDSTYTSDQDGIRVFDAGESASRLYPWETFVSIKGGEFRNCRNRSIKLQVNYATISGVSFYRDANLAATGGVGGREIDLQVGGGSVTDINCLYIDHVPVRILHLTGARTEEKKVPGNSIKGVRAVIAGSVTLPHFGASAAFVAEPQKIVISDVEILGNMGTFFALDTYATGVTGKPQGDNLIVRDIVCSPSDAFITVARHALAGPTNSTVFGSNCINVSGSEVPFVSRTDISTLCLVSANDCYGFTSATSGHGRTVDLVQDPFQRVEAIAPAGTLATGVLRPYAVVIGAGATVNLPVNGYSQNVGLIIASIGANVVGNAAILAVNRAGATVVHGGMTWVAGTTSDPGSGDWRVWSSGDYTTGLYVKNNTATARTVTFYMFG
jgi:hypothetical protein